MSVLGGGVSREASLALPGRGSTNRPAMTIHLPELFRRFRWLKGARLESPAPVEEPSDELMAILRCPISGAPLAWNPIVRRLRTADGNMDYDVIGGIPIIVPPVECNDDEPGDPAEFALRYDRIIGSARMQEFYGESGYFNVGYWTPQTPDLGSACERLVDEVSAAIPASAKLILDVGCGVGAATLRIIKTRPGATVIGVNVSLWQLQQARRRGVAISLVSNATKLAIRSDSIDAVTAIESAQHFVTRADFFSESFRVLRGGGRIALADMLFSHPEKVGSWMLCDANRLESVEEYKALLEAAGFVNVLVTDVTNHCWMPYCAALRSVYKDEEGIVDTLERSLSHYVIASATKPQTSASSR